MKNVIKYLIIIIILVGISYYLGTQRYFNKPDHITLTDTSYFYDTITHTINDTNYIEILDTTFIVDTNYINLDSAELVKAYYSKYFYNRSWKDSLIEVNLYDGITQNKPFKSDFSYKILRPQTIVTNTYTSYNKYVSLGVRGDLSNVKGSAIEIYYIQPKVNLGASYEPFTKSINLSISKNIFKWK